MRLTLINLKASAAIAFTIALGVLTLTPHAAAQRQTAVVATIPFAFQVGGTAMPAGDYLIKEVASGSVELENRATGKGVFAGVLAGEKAGPSAIGFVGFRKYGDTYFLSEMAVPNTTVDYKCPAGKQEKEVSRVTAAGNIQVALNARP